MIRRTIMNAPPPLDRQVMQTTIRCVYMHVAEREDLWSSSPHGHGYHELCYVLKGKGLYWIDDVEYSMEAGDLFFLPKGIRHAEAVDGKDPYKLCFLMMEHTGEGAREVERMLYSRPMRMQVSGQASLLLRQEIDRLIEEVINHQDGYLAMVDSILKQLYLMTYRQMSDDRAQEQAHADRADRQTFLFHNLRRYVAEERGFLVTVEELAHHFNYHPKYLTQLVKKETGKTLSEYLLFVRVENAKELLGKTQHPIVNVIDMSGFRNSNYFFRVFKQETGMTPMQYRRMLQHAPREDVPKL